MPKKAKKTFTSRMIPGLPPGEPGGTWYTSKDLRGFILRSYPDGGKFFACRYRVKKTGRRTVVSLGEWGAVVTCAMAHAKAKELLAQAALGEDPRPRERVTTWDQWSKKYFSRGQWKRPDEQARYLGISEETTSKRGAARNSAFREIRAKWASRTLDSFTVEDIEQAREDVREHGRILANRWLATIAATFAAAVKSEIITRNPCVNVRADRENASRQRVLSPDEMKSLLAAAYADANVYARAFILLAAMTGARSGELLAAEWTMVDLDGRVIRLPDSKGGKPRLLPLPPRAAELIEALPRFGKYVIAGAKADQPKPDAKSIWRRIARRAGLRGVTPHDLRRTFSVEVQRLSGVHVASRALGHASISQTEAAYLPENFAATLEATDKRAALMPMPAEAAKGGQP
jgi:integrase